MNQQIVLIPKDFQLNKMEVERLKKKFAFLTDNRITEIEENHLNDEVVGTIIDPKNKTLYPFSGDLSDIRKKYNGIIWRYGKFIIYDDLVKKEGAEVMLMQKFDYLTAHEVFKIFHGLKKEECRGAVINGNPKIKETKMRRFMVFYFNHNQEDIINGFTEAETVDFKI